MVGSDYKFYTDISGTVKKSNDDIYIGTILFNDRFRSDFRDKFYREFPSLRSFTSKGTKLNPDRLKNVITFMNNNHFKMAIVLLPRYIIDKCRRRVEATIREAKHITGPVSIRDFEERLMGLAYFQAIKLITRPNGHYDCYFCMESQIKIQECFVSVNRIAYKNGIHLRCSCTPRRTEHMLKFADFCASAGRKIDKFVLDQFTNVKFLKYEPTDRELDIAFCISKREKPPASNTVTYPQLQNYFEKT